MKVRRVKRRFPYILMILAAVVYLAALIVFGFSNTRTLTDAFDTVTGHVKVRLSSGSYPVETTALKAVVTDEDIASLDKFTQLRSADFSGSTCYNGILQYKASHPEVSVSYSVDFPNGTTATNYDSSVNLAGLRHEDVQDAISSLSFLPGVSSLDLGSDSVSSSPVTAGDIDSIRAALPGAQVAYSVNILGREYSIYDQTVDLSGVTTAQLPQVVSSLGYLRNLQQVNVTDNATTDGSLAWADLGTIGAAAPNAAINYKFSVCGVSATTADTGLDLSAITHGDVENVLAVLQGMNQLTWLNIGGDYNDLTYDDIDRLFAAAPNAVFSYTTSLWGKSINFCDEALDFNHISMNDQGASVKKILPYMRACHYLDMDFCDVDNAHMAEIRDQFPNIEVVWRIWFGSGGENGYSVRTNVETILASKPSTFGKVKNSDGESLKYCTKVKNLDLGHNSDLTDVSFIANMPDLEVCILTLTDVTSLEPFRNCTKLDYLEVADMNISDVSPLAGLTNLRHLNIGVNKGISDITSLYGLTGLERLYCGGCPIPAEQKNEMKNIVSAAGNTKFELSENMITLDDGSRSTTEGMWRYDNYTASVDDWIHMQETGYWSGQMQNHPRYQEIREIFRYSEAPACYSAARNDPLYYPHD